MKQNENIPRHCEACNKRIEVHVLSRFGVIEFCYSCYEYYNTIRDDMLDYIDSLDD